MIKNMPEGFTEPNKKVLNRMICSVVGRDKKGKTHYSLTAPAPIAFFNLNTGLEGVVQKFEKEIWEFRLELPKELGSAESDKDAKRAAAIDMKNLAMMEVEKFLKGWKTALLNAQVKTIVIDTASELWALYRLAEFGKSTQVPPHLYNYLNAKFKREINKIYATNKNLILLHQMKEEYIENAPTGKYIREGFKEIGHMVQTNLIATRMKEKTKYPLPGQPNPPFVIIVENSRTNPDLLETEFVGMMATFPMVSSMITGTPPKEWK